MMSTDFYDDDDKTEEQRKEEGVTDLELLESRKKDFEERVATFLSKNPHLRDFLNPNGGPNRGAKPRKEAPETEEA
jgi:hypothetical protein